MSEDPQGSTATEERPNFGPTQVTSPEQLVVGRSYRRHHAEGRTYTPSSELGVVRVLEEPQGRWVKVERSDMTFDYSLADMGVIPYDSGYWNATNWLEDLGSEE